MFKTQKRATRQTSNRNRKMCHSHNIQAVFGPAMRFLSVLAGHPGSSHDAYILQSSSLFCQFESGELSGRWLLGLWDQDEDLIFGSIGWKCKYLNGDSLVISPTLYLGTSDCKKKTHPSVPTYLKMLDSQLVTKTIKLTEEKSKTFTSSSSPFIMKYFTVKKDIEKAKRNGNSVKRLIRITDISSRQKLDLVANSEERITTSEDQCYKDKNVIQQRTAVCAFHKYTGDSLALKHEESTTENYKEVLAKLRGQTALRSFSNASRNGAMSSFYGHIQTCILHLSNRGPMQPFKAITSSDNSSFVKQAGSKLKVSEGHVRRSHTNHSNGSFLASPVISMNKACRIEGEKEVWRQNMQEISRSLTYDDKARLVQVTPPSPGKENTYNVEEVWGFPAFHPYPLKSQRNCSSNSSRGSTRSGKRNQSAPRLLYSPQSLSRHSSDTNKDAVTLGSQVTLGLMFSAIRTGLKPNHI